jgi:DNA-binding MurR/RpiR family transcriptional regulator
VFAVDLRRYQTGTIQFAQAAARRGAHLILLTDQWQSPVATEAEVVLTAALDAPSPFDSLVGAAAVVETLVAGVVDRLGDKPKVRMRAYDAVWRSSDVPHAEPTPRTDRRPVEDR